MPHYQFFFSFWFISLTFKVFISLLSLLWIYFYLTFLLFLQLVCMVCVFCLYKFFSHPKCLFFLLSFLYILLCILFQPILFTLKMSHSSKVILHKALLITQPFPWGDKIFWKACLLLLLQEFTLVSCFYRFQMKGFVSSNSHIHPG